MNSGKGVLLKVISAVLFTVMSALIRDLGVDYPTGQVIFFRSAFAILPVVVVYAWRGELMNWKKRTMRVAVLAAAALAMLVTLLANSWASAAEYKVTVKSAISYAEHAGVRLLGDLYLPEGRSKAPVVVAFHGGAWRSGSRTFYKYWGPFLARNGYALFTVDYRLGKAGRYPAAVQDAKAAVEFVRARAEEFHIDPQRVGLMGDSAGGQLAALLALAADRFTEGHGDDANAATPIDVKAVVGFYGIYDLLAQWNHDGRRCRSRRTWRCGIAT